MSQEDPFFNIRSYEIGSGRMDIKLSTIFCPDDICFEISELVKSETYDPLTESPDTARENAFVKAATEDDYFVNYLCE